MRWSDFATSCPELADLVRARFETEQIFLLGTLRPDGSPRISGVECDFVGDDLMVGMIWQSVKALDLLRDPRCTVHSLVPDKAHESSNQGDLKLYGTAVAISDREHRKRYEAALQARIGWHPEEPYHCFALDLEQVGIVGFGDGVRYAWGWRPETGFRKRELPELGVAAEPG